MERLKRWRGKTSAALGLPAYRVLTNATIQRIAQERPRTSSELEAIHGVGAATIESFGHDVVQVVLDFEAQVARLDPNPQSSAGTTQVSVLPVAKAEASAVAPNVDASSGVAGQQVLGRAEQQDAYWTWRLFRDGYSWDQIKLIRCRDDASLTRDLRLATAAGHAIEAAWLDGTQAASLLPVSRVVGG